MMRERIESLIEKIESQKGGYKRFLKKRDRVRKRERDTFISEKDKTILIQSFAIGGILEKLILKAIDRIF